MERRSQGPLGTKEQSAQSEMRRAATARIEVVEILATAVFSLLIDGRLPPVPAEHAEEHGECS